MKKFMFLIVLVFFITIIILGNYVISNELNISDQNKMSKTKENSEIYESKVLLETEDVNTVDSLSKIDITNQQEETNEIITSIEEYAETIPIADEQATDEQETDEQTIDNLAINDQMIEQDVIQTQEVELEPATYISRYSFLTTDGEIEKESIIVAEKEISRIPQNMLNIFEAEGWRIEISNANISAKYFGGRYGNVMGVTITDQHVIVIQNRTSSIQSSIIHEFGHYIDTRFDFPSLSDEFWEIYLQEVDTFISRIPNSSSVRDEMEFFASTFYYMMKDPSKCTPRATEFVQRYINSF